MDAIVHAADIQDRDGGVLLMATLFGLYPFLLKLYADAGYQGPKFKRGLARVCRKVNLEIVRRCDTGREFSCLPSWPQYCRATPTECSPFLGTPVSSTIKARIGPRRLMMGRTRARTAASTVSSDQFAFATK